MKLKIAKLIGIASIILGSIFYVGHSCSVEKQLQQAQTYISNYENDLAGKDSTIYVLQMTTNQLKNSKDSINQKLCKALEDLKIKEKNAKEIQYIKEKFIINDTITFTDTVFVSEACLDTTIYWNEYSKMHISIAPPYKLNLMPEITSEKYVVSSYKKEFVNTPSKIFFIRWFQKKRKVITVDILEENDLIKVDQKRFINIIE